MRIKIKNIYNVCNDNIKRINDLATAKLVSVSPNTKTHPVPESKIKPLNTLQ
jgi:D-serine deaminase-like pyridoxal phosphate-dependent protein